MNFYSYSFVTCLLLWIVRVFAWITPNNVLHQKGLGDLVAFDLFFSSTIGLIIGIVIVAVIALWIIAGFYIVGPAKQAVIQRFGKYVRTENPGMHWIPRFIEAKTIVNIQEVTAYTYEADMLTKDENIVNVTLVVHYRIDNPSNFLFNVKKFYHLF